MAGIVAGQAAEQSARTDCRLHLPTGTLGVVEGRFLARTEAGRSLPFRIEAGVPPPCRTTVRAIWPRGMDAPPTGERIQARARWEGRSHPDARLPQFAGRLFLDTPQRVEVDTGDLRGRALRLRGRILDRIGELWSEDEAPVVEALVLARREHLDSGLRSAFGVSGTAHLLAISGFHVGVVAGFLLALLRALRLGPRRAAGGAALGSWLYVLGIGAPDAALRACVLLSLIALARIRGVPPVSTGALSSAFLFLLILDPSALRSVGFQLSFAGTGGLLVLRRPLEAAFDRQLRRLGRTPPGRGPDAAGVERWLRGGSDGLLAGTAATLPTLPLLAWHFDRASLVGIPATLVVAPLVTLAIPGIGAALASSVVWEPAGRFMAGGAGLLLGLTGQIIVWAAAVPGAAPWVSRPALLAGAGAALATLFLLGLRSGPRGIRSPVRRGAAGSMALVAVLLLPLWPATNTLDIHMIDVGQGDAFALRTPAGRWVLVDAGAASDTWDAGERRVVPYLRRLGVRRLEALVLSHPHLDHLGGAPAVLAELPVDGVLDPSDATGSRSYQAVIESAREGGVSWWTAHSELETELDGVGFRVLHPGSGVETSRDPALGVPADPNDVSIVLLVEWEGQAVLFTGDAYMEVENAILHQLPELSVLKVGHHGSRTSTSEALLQRTRPRWALIPAGDGNRFGHPHAEVTERLERVGARQLRSDRDGHVRLRLHRDGRITVRTNR